MSGEVKLDPCPFCGKSIGLQLCDSEGNFRNPEYEDEPWSGIGFQLIHEVEDGICPIATHDGESIGSFIYDTREDAAEGWNRRAADSADGPLSEIQDDVLVGCSFEDGKRVGIEINLDHLHRDVGPDVAVDMVASELEVILRQAGFPLRVVLAPEGIK